jgi:hypothetical protein
MFHVLVSGVLVRKPSQHVDKAGRDFLTGVLRTSDRAGTIFVSFIAWDHEARRRLSELGEADAVALSGELKVGALLDSKGKPKADLDVVVHGVLTVSEPA